MEEKRLYISFYLNKQRKSKNGACTIYMRLTLAGQRENINTGIWVNERLWDRGKARIKGSTQEVTTQNNLLTAIKSRAIAIYTELLNDDKLITSAIIKNKLVGVNETRVTLLEAVNNHNRQISNKIGVKRSKGTLVKYETLKIKLEQYIRYKSNRKDILLRELNYSFVLGFESFLKSQGIGHNTAVKYIQFLKRVINYSIANQWLNVDPFKEFKCSFKPVIRECLTMSEVLALRERRFDCIRLNQVKDIFVFCCYTGLSYADVKKLNKDEIVIGMDDHLWIQTVREKTNIRVPVPLLPDAVSIIKKYELWREKNGKSNVFPVLSNQKMNAYLKEIADVCQIRKKLTFHIARHTFATTITLSNGVPIETVSKMLGHTNIRTTQIYSKVVDLKISEDMIKLSTKLKE